MINKSAIFKSRLKRKTAINRSGLYKKPKMVESIQAVKILDWLNSASTPDGISNAVSMYFGEQVMSIRNAQKLLRDREQLGAFKDLAQVAAVPGIGEKKFNALIYALSILTLEQDVPS